jgi:hypothetical protein
MTTPTEVTITLDAKTKAIRSGSRWAIQRRQTDGSWDMTDHWDGSRRSLLQWAERNGVYPTREAEAVLATLSEGVGFKER